MKRLQVPRPNCVRIAASTLVLTGLVIGVGSSDAQAQISQACCVNTIPSASVPTRGTDIAFDTKNAVFLAVTGNQLLSAVFTHQLTGDLLTQTYAIAGDPNVNYVKQPRVVYSPDLNDGVGGTGAFMVTWIAVDPAFNVDVPHAQIVSYPKAVQTGDPRVGSPVTLANAYAYWEFGAPVAYSPASQRFLVVWQSFPHWTPLRGIVLGLNGQPVSGVIDISDPGFARDPGVAWNPITNEFGVSYNGELGDGLGPNSAFARVSTSGAVLRRNVFSHGAGTFITDLAVNTATGNYVMVWHQQPGGATYAAEFNPGGDLLGMGLLASNFEIGTSTGLSVEWGGVSRTFLVLGHRADIYEDGIPRAVVGGLELNSRGNREGNVILASRSEALGTFDPRAAAHSAFPLWMMSYSANFAFIKTQTIATSTVNGGSTTTLGTPPPAPPPGAPPPPPPPPPPGGCTTPDPFVALGGGTCVNGGWFPPGSSGGTTTTPGGCTTPDPFAAIGGGTCVNGGWVPGTSSPSSTSGGCSTPDPFASIGGGTCITGGWVPGTSSTSSSGSSGGCSTPDPFASIGGGTCVNGGWVPGTSSPSSGGSGGCSTPDPFTSIGGGTCINGGWVPGTSSGGSGGCSTPDPFASIGGGVCVNGGWVPIGSSTSAAPAGSAPVVARAEAMVAPTSVVSLSAPRAPRAAPDRHV